MRNQNLKLQAGLEFITQYALEILVLVVAVAAVYIIQEPFHQTTYSASYCYITTSLNCYQMLTLSSQSSTMINITFTNDMGQSIYLPSNSGFFVDPEESGQFIAGTCNTSATDNILKNGQSATCNATVNGFSATAGTQLQPRFYLNYEVCSNALCTSIVSNPGTFSGEKTAGSAITYVAPSAPSTPVQFKP